MARDEQPGSPEQLVPPRTAARVGLVDDHPAVGLGVAVILDTCQDIRLVAAAPTVNELLAITTDLDLVLLDLRLSDGSTPTMNVTRLRATDALVLAYTSGDDPGLVREGARAELAGMLRKSEPPAALVQSIRAALAGEVIASTEWAAAIDADAHDAAVALTPREMQVLELYASGEKANRVARMLGISRETVLDHIRRIRTKYAEADRPAHTKVDLYRRAVEDGMLAPPR